MTTNLKEVKKGKIREHQWKGRSKSELKYGRLKPIISVITLILNGLKIWIRRQRLGIKKGI